MTTARFAIELSLSSSPDAKVRKVLRRADSDRAVLHAETWLRRSRLSGQNYVLWYDQWTVYSVDDEGCESVVARGVAGIETTTGGDSKRNLGKKAKQGNRGSNAGNALRNARILQSDSGLLGRHQTGILPKTARVDSYSRMSPRRAGIAAMVERAKRKLADDEFIPPMGSNQDGQI